MIPLTWKHVEARADAEFVVAPAERLGWTRTVDIGAQHAIDVLTAAALVGEVLDLPTPPFCFGVYRRSLRLQPVALVGLLFGAHSRVAHASTSASSSCRITLFHNVFNAGHPIFIPLVEY